MFCWTGTSSGSAVLQHHALSTKIMLGPKIHQHTGYMKHDQYHNTIEALNKITAEIVETRGIL
jgi:hypothetical protein